MLEPVQQGITIDKRKFKLRFFTRPPEGSNKFTLHKQYKISVGMKGYESPRGFYEVIRRGRNVDWYMPNSSWVPEESRGTVIPGKDPRNPIKARWIEIYDGAGIHGTDDIESLGTRASHGCFRMSVPDVIELFDLVKINCPVIIY